MAHSLMALLVRALLLPACHLLEDNSLRKIFFSWQLFS